MRVYFNTGLDPMTLYQQLEEIKRLTDIEAVKRLKIHQNYNGDIWLETWYSQQDLQPLLEVDLPNTKLKQALISTFEMVDKAEIYY